jgi:hypothetical protein
MPTERPPLVGEVSANVVSVTDPYGRILGFLDRSRYFFFQVTPQLYSSRLSGPHSVSRCGLVVTVLGYRSRGPSLIPGATRFS